MESYFSFQGYDFLYFDTPVNFYTLYRTTRKINTFQEFEYIAEVLIYLNSNLSKEMFDSLMLQLGDKSNQHVIRTYSEERILNMCDLVYDNRKVPYCKRKRKIVFNPSRIIPVEEKRIIIGSVLSSKSNEESIYMAVESLMESKEKITLDSISNILKCSRQTISKKITGSLKEIIKYHNSNLKENKDKEELFKIISNLTSEGKDKMKIRALKKLTSIRDYNLIKKCIDEYFGN